MSAVSGQRNQVSRVASGDLSALQYTFVKEFGASNTAVYPATTVGEVVYGILQNKPRNQEHATVCVDGFTKVTLGGSLGAGATVMVNSNAAAIAATSGQYICGRINRGGNSGSIGEMFLTLTGSRNA